VIRLLLALLFNQFTIARRRRSLSLGKGAGCSAGRAMVEMAAQTPFRPIRCSLCDHRLEESLYRRIPAVTRLEQFLQLRRFRMTAFAHAAHHVAIRYGFPPLHYEKALDIRRGLVVATAEQQQHIALAVSNLLGEVVPPSTLFDDAVVLDFIADRSIAARRQA
jgi:hypothetical protein